MRSNYGKKKEVERKMKEYYRDNGRFKQQKRRHRKYLELTGGINLIKGII
ncbi:MAG: hypothetical protein WC677_08850 [Clostridia bacterium]|jgi:hypothetical protein